MKQGSIRSEPGEQEPYPNVLTSDLNEVTQNMNSLYHDTAWG
jgi:hypothetical protein